MINLTLLIAMLFYQPGIGLKNVSIIDGTGAPVRAQTSMIIVDGRIKSIGGPIPADMSVIDMSGKFIMPLINNAHGHLGNVKDTTMSASNYTPDNVRHQMQRYLDYGVGAVLSMGTEQPIGIKIRDSSQADLIPGATMYSAIYGFGVKNNLPPESMGFSHIYRPVTASEAIRDVDELAPLKPDCIKIWVDGNPTMTEEIYTAIIHEAHRHKIRVASHLYRLSDARKLVAAGVDIIAHSIRDEEIDEAFAAEIRKKNIIYIPTLSLDDLAFIYAENPEWLNDPFFRNALEPGVYEMVTSPVYKEKIKNNPAAQKEKAALRIAMKNLMILHKAGVTIALGTDSGAMPIRIQGFAEHLEMELMVEAGLTPLEVIRTATLNSAALLKADKLTGSLEPGKRASFIVLDKDPSSDIRNTRSISAVWVKGKAQPAAFAAAQTPSVKVSGEVTKHLQLQLADLAKMKRTTVSLKDRDGNDHPYTGVPISEILEMAGVTTGQQLHGPNMAKYLLVKCADGYQVVFSLAELDASITDKMVILADSMEGKPLPTGKGPFRLVVPGEKRPARSSFQVTELVIRSAKD